MRVDFYQLSRDPAEVALAQLAGRALQAGERVLVVSGDEAQLARIATALWQVPGSFLAHDVAGGPHDARQPILLSKQTEAANGARFLMIADGNWRECDPPFERTFFLFDDSTIAAARDVWRALKDREGLSRHFWRKEGGRWTEVG